MNQPLDVNIIVVAKVITSRILLLSISATNHFLTVFLIFLFIKNIMIILLLYFLMNLIIMFSICSHKYYCYVHYVVKH